MAGLTDVEGIDGGDDHTCARRTGGTIACWGDNGYRQLGDGTRDSPRTPVPVSGVTGAAEVTAGSRHSCARLTTGGAVCWGDNQFGQSVTERRRRGRRG